MISSRPESNLEEQSLQRANTLLNSLSDISIQLPSTDLCIVRFRLFVTLYNEVCHFMVAAEKEKFTELLKKLRVSIDDQDKNKPSNFIQEADSFDGEIRNFIIQKVKIQR